MIFSKNISFGAQLKFGDVSKNNVQQQVLNMNSKKPGTFGNIPIRYWKVPVVSEV